MALTRRSFALGDSSASVFAADELAPPDAVRRLQKKKISSLAFGASKGLIRCSMPTLRLLARARSPERVNLMPRSIAGTGAVRCTESRFR